MVRVLVCLAFLTAGVVERERPVRWFGNFFTCSHSVVVVVGHEILHLYHIGYRAWNLFILGICKRN